MRSVIFLIFYCFFITPVFSNQKVEILVESGHFPPFKFIGKEGGVTGIYPEIVKAAVSGMPNYSVKFIEQPWSRCKRAVELGKAFAMLPPYFHADDWLTEKEPKRPYIWPYSLPLFTQTDIAVCNKAKLGDLKIHPRSIWPDDYVDLSFTLQKGDGIAGTQFDQLVEQKKINVIYTTTNFSTIKFLMLGRADCTVISKAPYYWFIKEMKEKGEYNKFDKGIVLTESVVLGTNNGYLGYTDINAEENYPYKKDFSIKFDIQIHRMKKSGEINEIIESFIDQ